MATSRNAMQHNPHVHPTVKLIDSTDRVVDVLKRMRSVKKFKNGNPLKNVERVFEQARSALHHHRMFSMNWHMAFMYLGAQFLQLVKADDSDAYDRSLAELLQKKSGAYGDTPIEAWGPLGVIIRMDSKLLRYVNLTNNPELNAKQADESITDTLNDLVGYAVLGYRLTTRRGMVDNPEEIERLEQQLHTNEQVEDKDLDLDYWSQFQNNPTPQL